MGPCTGIIITVSVLVAAGLAAYESEQFREWFERTRHKLAMQFQGIEDDFNPARFQRRQTDVSMREAKGEEAESRRQQAVADIMERGRAMDEKRKRRKLSDDIERSPTFDNLVDSRGMLRSATMDEKAGTIEASTSGRETTAGPDAIRPRNTVPDDQQLHESVDASLQMRQLRSSQDNRLVTQNPFESRYEQELRSAWDLPLPEVRSGLPSSHASESLIDLTPTTEEVPDPEISVPSAELLHHPLDRSDYFSAAASRASSHTWSEREYLSESNHESQHYYAHPSNPLEPINPRNETLPSSIHVSVSSASSVAGSTDHITMSEVEDSEFDAMSEIGDGIRTPASVWTEVGSVTSGEA